MTNELALSYRHCQSLARRTGRNFYFSFLTLPRRLFRDMCVLYAFMRHTDDLGDEPGLAVEERRRRLQAWRERLDIVLAGGDAPESRILPALADVAARHAIPAQYLHDVIAGVESDLSPRDFETFEDLSRYCYHVAGAVGLCCIHIWGFRDDRARERAIDCGLAFQLTNILRDLGEDARLGRVYLPREDLKRFGYTEEDIRRGVRDERFANLMRFQVERAKGVYARAAELSDLLHPAGRPILATMLRIYRGLLSEIERRGYDVYTSRVALPAHRKLGIAVTSLFGKRFREVEAESASVADDSGR